MKREVSDVVREDFWRDWWARFSKEQVIHDTRQVKNPAELEIGKIYQHVHIDRKIGQKIKSKLLKIIALNVLTLLSGKNEFNPKWFKAKYTDDGNWKETEGNFCMTYYGIVPYSNGMWDKFNYLVPAE